MINFSKMTTQYTFVNSFHLSTRQLVSLVNSSTTTVSTRQLQQCQLVNCNSVNSSTCFTRQLVNYNSVNSSTATVSTRFTRQLPPKLVFTEFCQYAASRFRVQERDVQLLSALTGSLVNQTHTLRLTLSQSFSHAVLNSESDMVNTLVSLI